MSGPPRTRRGLLTPGRARADGAELEPLLSAQVLSLACVERVLAVRAFAAAPASHRSLVRTVGAAERVHVERIQEALRARGGRVPAAPPTAAEIDRELARHLVPGRPSRLRGPGDSLTLLIDVQRVAIGAGYVALASISDGRLSVLVARMMGSDAQHEALLEEARHPGAIAAAIPYGVVEGVE